MNKEPEVGEIIVQSDKISEKFRRFVSQISGIITGATAITPSLPRFADLNAVNALYKSPYDGQLVIINNIICQYDKQAAIWRKADGTGA